MRYNRTKPQPYLVIPRVKDFRIPFCFRRLAFERPVVPFAPLPLRGWNTVTCLLVFTPPGRWFSEGVADVVWLSRLADGAYPLRGKSLFCLPGGGQNHFFFCSAKEKAVLDSEKEKVDQWKFWRGAVQPHKAPTLLGYPSGKRL